MKHLYSAGVVVYRFTKKKLYYLLLRYASGHWDFAKGNIEENESKTDAALRELYEEAGITAQLDETFEENFSYIFTDRDKQRTKKTVYFFLGKTKQTKIILSFEHIDYAWLSYTQALEMLTYNNAKMLLQKAHTYLTTQQKELS